MLKHFNTVLRLLVGGLFIFSGLIKVNDPVGTSIKLEEYFEVFSVEFASFFHVFVPVALPLAVILVVLEVVLGIAIIINYKPKLTQYTILALIIFFTFLTGYSAITNTVTDCGCFGDAIKLTPWESFTKDIILLVMIAVIIFVDRQRGSQDQSATMVGHGIIVATTIVSLALSITAINHLPFIDFRAYKIGDSIPANMKPSEPFIYEYLVEKDGEEYTFNEYPNDKSYNFISMTHVNPEAAPTITDFAVWNDEGDFTEEVFQGNKLFVILYDVNKSDLEGLAEINTLTQSLAGKVEIFALTASAANTYEAFAQKNQINVPYYYTDATVLKTITRSNPGLWLLQDGTVKGKWHYNDVPNYSEVLDLLNL
ncbi:BT_3928 family protein [Reichenbachiella sp. MSK19-1]|uniref:BT_3928 family protein n=1 Tax=Reichenbachiella sp. MSK19-1 TaxID=1897631 RepID=UPI000E6D034D|nr:BT_3928 family protein [Reichenbachiella sp. MSK19-1]RJE74166.1 DoxX family protein [Reichenbachiella sp. MSK19-1]